jgi:hypothetical protein
MTTLNNNATLQDVINAINNIYKLLEDNNTNDNNNEFTDLVSEFISIYPTRTPGGRILSPSNLNTVAGSKISKKLISITKGDINKLKFIIKKLKDEVEYRKNTQDKIEFMKGVLVWLNNGEWENEYVLTKPAVIGVARGMAI